MKYHYNWSLKDYPPKNGLKVFSTFACGGGSTMGYKLAGYDVIGCNEIDPKMMEVYKKNHNPKYSYLEPIQDFKDRKDLPKELYDLDILDGSPPCSNFSMAGNREKDWGKKKKFREGQSLQVLDTLFFDFIELTKKLQPKVAIAENVVGLMQGNAISYVQKIITEFEDAGYYVNYWILDSSKMGVPQRRRRVFFIALRKDLVDKIEHERGIDLLNPMPYLDLEFNEKEITLNDFKIENNDFPLTQFQMDIWEMKKYGDSKFSTTLERERNQPNSNFGRNYLYGHKPINTLTSKRSDILFDEPRCLNDTEINLASSFPSDYDYLGYSVPYITGMSVPPLMIANIATRIKNEWFDKMK